VPIAREHLQQHLELAAAAYGSDLVLPAGRAVPRVEAVAAAAPPAVAKGAKAASGPGAAAAEAQGPPAADAGAPPPSADPDAALAALRREVLPCTRCKLHQARRTVVFGEGDPRARVMFVGEAPGAVEDQTGRPFVGPAGQLLDKIIANAMGLRRDDVYIANVNKCRPPGNREPEPDEVAACLPYLRRQVEIVQPAVIVALGRTAAHNLLGTTESTGRLRGRLLDYHGIPVVVTWHPAYLLRDPSHKRETWDDIKRVNVLLGRPEVPDKAAPPAGGA
jgi:DNA polymerase